MISLSMLNEDIFVLKNKEIITICAWCGYEINKNGIRKNVQYEKSRREGLSNGICLVCAMKNFN